MIATASRAFDATWLLGFLAARAVPGIEEVDGATYRRSLALAHGPAVIAVAVEDEPRWWLESGDPRDQAEAGRRVRKLLDLDADFEAIDRVLAAEPAFRAASGRRVPGCVDPAEMAVRAVLGQQVSVAAARTHAARLVEAYGTRLVVAQGEPPARRGPAARVERLFPASDALAELDPARLGMPRARGRALVGLAAALAGGLDPRDRDALLALPGIGPWTADYVAMRCGDPDILLETDLGVRRGAAALGLPTDGAGLRRHAERWRPWRSYAVQHLWAAA